MKMMRSREFLFRFLLVCLATLWVEGCVSDQEVRKTLPSVEVINNKTGQSIPLGDYDQSRIEYRLATQASVAGDRTTAYELLIPLAEQGDPGGQYNLGLMEEDGTKRREWIQKAAEQGHVMAKYSFGVMHWLGLGGLKMDPEKAARWVQESAELGYDPAQFLIGLMYDTGRGVPEDHSKAYKWLRRAADQGNFDAKCALKEPGACPRSKFYK